MLEVDIVTATKEYLKNLKCEWVKLPTLLGQITVLENHRSLLSVMDIGPVEVKVAEHDFRYFAISGGVLEVRNNRVTLLAETCEEASEIDVERAKRSFQRAEKALQGTLSKQDYQSYQARLRRAMNRELVASLRPPVK